ncbi:hypothetical protein [Croceitalea rosinachiae]|uniref:Cysteine rich repeat-containing protein n=1 Tax=Croceitalea rosinachiae TaxID=3075596 RepID=A0ABU3ABW1_9FLAO|nr:hypothetical protein [Croceitalea sp. F388]MDT0606406.1 hypothetical protein [Croceitalea sp. F388]
MNYSLDAINKCQEACVLDFDGILKGAQNNLSECQTIAYNAFSVQMERCYGLNLNDLSGYRGCIIPEEIVYRNALKSCQLNYDEESDDAIWREINRVRACRQKCIKDVIGAISEE